MPPPASAFGLGGCSSVPRRMHVSVRLGPFKPSASRCSVTLQLPCPVGFGMVISHGLHVDARVGTGLTALHKLMGCRERIGYRYEAGT